MIVTKPITVNTIFSFVPVFGTVILSVSDVVVDVEGAVSIESGVTVSDEVVALSLDSLVVSFSSVVSTSKVTFESLSFVAVSFSSVFALLFTLDTSGSVNLLITEISSSAPAIINTNTTMYHSGPVNSEWTYDDSVSREKTCKVFKREFGIDLGDHPRSFY